MKRIIFFTLLLTAGASFFTSCSDDFVEDSLSSEELIITEVINSKEISAHQTAASVLRNEITLGMMVGGERVTPEETLTAFEKGQSLSAYYKKKGYPNFLALEEAQLQVFDTQPLYNKKLADAKSRIEQQSFPLLEEKLVKRFLSQLLTGEKMIVLLEKKFPELFLSKRRTCTEQFSVDWSQCEIDQLLLDLPLIGDLLACQDIAVYNYNKCTGGKVPKRSNVNGSSILP